jgi:hypothetical protein
MGSFHNHSRVEDNLVSNNIEGGRVGERGGGGPEEIRVERLRKVIVTRWNATLYHEGSSVEGGGGQTVRRNNEPTDRKKDTRVPVARHQVSEWGP